MSIPPNPLIYMKELCRPLIRFLLCTSKNPNPNSNMNLKIRRKLLQLYHNKKLQSPVPRQQIRNPLFQIQLSPTALAMIYRNQKLASGAYLGLTGLVYYFAGGFWAVFPALLSLVKYADYRAKRQRIELGVKTITLKDLETVQIELMNGAKSEGAAKNYKFILDEKALEGQRSILAYMVTPNEGKPFRLTFTKKNSVVSNPDAMYAILTNNQELLKGFQIVQNEPLQQHESLEEEVQQKLKEKEEQIKENEEVKRKPKK